MYSLTCIVTGAERLTDSTISYQWFKDGETVTEENSATLSFTFLTLSDAGSYTCQATVTSSLLSASISSTSMAFICELQIQNFIIRYMTIIIIMHVLLVSDLVTLPPTTIVSNLVMTEIISPPPSKFIKI